LALSSGFGPRDVDKINDDSIFPLFYHSASIKYLTQENQFIYTSFLIYLNLDFNVKIEKKWINFNMVFPFFPLRILRQ